MLPQPQTTPIRSGTNDRINALPAATLPAVAPPPWAFGWFAGQLRADENPGRLAGFVA